MANFKSETYLVADYWDIEKLIKEVYGRDYHLPMCEEKNNDSYMIFDVEPDFKNGDSDVEDLEKFKNGEEIMYRTDIILNDMCRQGKLAAGRYLIRICW
jgi:hypothetical protein